MSTEDVSSSRSPKVSVVMPVYNGERYLSAALESILMQSFEDYEFVIVNDGSTDESLNIINTYAASDSRIRVISQDNRGLVHALNEGLSVTRGEYIARMDADDIAFRSRLEKQVEEFERNGDLVALGARVIMIDAEDRPVKKVKHALDHAQIVKRLLIGDGSALSHPVVMMRRSALFEVGCYDERFTTCEDLDVYLKLSEVGRVANLKDFLLYYRHHTGSICNNMSHEWMHTKRMAIADAIARRGPSGFACGLFPELQYREYKTDPVYMARLSQEEGFLGTSLHYCWRIVREGPRRRTAIRYFLRNVKAGFGRFMTSVIRPLRRA